MNSTTTRISLLPIQNSRDARLLRRVFPGRKLLLYRPEVLHLMPLGVGTLGARKARLFSLAREISRYRKVRFIYSRLGSECSRTALNSGLLEPIFCLRPS